MPRIPIYLILVVVLGLGLITWAAEKAFACSCALDERWQLRRVLVTEDGKPVSNLGVEYQFEVVIQAAADGRVSLQASENDGSVNPTYQAVYVPKK